jgi:hypothetical protein
MLVYVLEYLFSGSKYVYFYNGHVFLVGREESHIFIGLVWFYF